MRKYIDCSEFPGSTCSVRISGEENEIVRLAEEHAVLTHGEQRGAKLTDQIQSMLKPE